MRSSSFVLSLSIGLVLAGCAADVADPGSTSSPPALTPSPEPQPEPEPKPEPAPEPETCSPRGTPTCGPDGRPVTPMGGPPPPPGGDPRAPALSRVDATLRTLALTGSGPQGLDVDPATGLVYVANNGNVIAGCDGDVSHAPVPGSPEPPREGSSTLSIVDPAKGELARAATGAAPIWPLVDASRGVVWVANSGDGSVTAHDPKSGAIAASIALGGRPHAIGIAPSGLMIVSNTNDSTQTYYATVDAATRAVLAHRAGPSLNHGIAWDAAEGVFYLVGVADGTVNVIDGATGATLDRFAGSSDGFGNSNMLAFSAEHRRLFVSDTKQTHVVSIVDVDAGERVGTIAFGQGAASAWGMEVDPSTGLLYVALPNADAIGVADAQTGEPLALVPVGECPYAVRLDVARGLGFSTGMVESDLTVFDLETVRAAVRP